MTVANHHPRFVMDFRNGGKLPLIICDQCDKPVDEVAMEVNHYDDMLCFHVKCHGDTDRCKIPRYMVEEGIDLSQGRAFTTKRIVDHSI